MKKPEMYRTEKSLPAFIMTWISLLLYSLIIAGCQSTEEGRNSQEATHQQKNQQTKDVRIVSLNGTLTEVLCALGYEKSIVGVDVTSTYPVAMQALPKVGHNRNIQAEGVLSLKPTLVVGKKGELKPELEQQLSAANIDLQLFPLDYSPEGAQTLIEKMASQLKKSPKGKQLVEKMNADLLKIEKLTASPKVLFIYARGAGTLMVAGEGTPVQKMIKLAGGQNAVTGFVNFKPLTAEALIKANPDVILLFDSGLKSLEGGEGLLKVPGIKETDAGRNKAFITMDGQLLTGFSPRLGQAAQILNHKLKAFTTIAKK